MKKIITSSRSAIIALATLGISSATVGAVEFWTEGFETDGATGGTPRYTIGGGAEFHTGLSDYFTRINDSNGNGAGGETPDIDLDADPPNEYTDFTGAWYYAAEDTAGGDWRTMDFDINTATHENLTFRIDVAAGDTDTGPSYDHNHFLAVLYSTDGGTNYLPGLVFRYGGTDADLTNHPFRRVNNIRPSGRTGFTNLTQVGNMLATGVMATDDQSTGLIFESMGSDDNDGTPLTGNVAVGTILNTGLQEFSFSPPNAANLRIRVVMDVDDANVEVAFDNLRLEGDVVATNPAPTLVNTTAPNVGEVEIGDTSYSFTVQYGDDSGVVASTIDASDVTVTGPGGPVSVTAGSTTDPDGTSLTATYTITPPGGTWDAADNGLYNIAIAAGEVGDDGGPQLFVDAGAAGSFNVNATNTPPTLNTIVASDVTASNFGQSSYSFTVDYTDVGGVSASSIGTADVTVTGPGGPLTVTAGTTTDPDGTEVTATYTVTPPGGTWDDADDGVYTIAIVGSEVTDVVGGAVAANAAAATFSVDSNQIFCEPFETDGGGGARYTVDNQFYGTTHQYFTRIRDINGNAAGGETPLIDLDSDSDDEYDDFLGEHYFAGENFTGADFRTIDFNQINTAAHAGLSFSGLFAEGDTDATPSPDSDHFMAVLYSVDGGANYVPGLVFRPTVTAADVTNFRLREVDVILPSGSNGVNTQEDLGAKLSAGTIVSGLTAGEAFSFMAADTGGTTAAVGGALSHALSSFGFTIPGNPATVDLRIVVQANDQNVEVAFDHLKLSGTFTGLNIAPSVVALTAADVGEAEIGDTSYSFTVDYGDDSEVVASTIAATNVTVTGPGGPVTVTSGSTTDPDGSPLTATYSFTPPGGDWDVTDNGTYTVDIVTNEVGDDGAVQLFVAAGSAGSFEVDATNTPPIVANVAVTNVVFGQFGETSYSFDVTYTDADEVDASTIGSSDVTVTGPGGPVSISSGTTSDPDGASVKATYTFTPPGGNWDGADVGVYTVGIVGSEVDDNQGDSVAADAAAETFEVFDTKLLDEGFEKDGEGTRYTTNGGAANHFFEASSSTSYFTRVIDNGSGPNPAILLDADPAGTNYSGFDGEAYFAAENVEFSGRPAFRVVDIAPIDTSAFTTLNFMGLFAAGDTDANPSYDSDHFMAVLYSIDGGTTYLPGAVFRANVTVADATNKPLQRVNTIAPSGSNGINTLADLGAQLSTGSIVTGTAAGESFSYMAADTGPTNAAVGTALTPAFAPFSFNIPDAAEVRLRLVLHSDAVNVEMAFDSLMVNGAVIPQPPTALNISRNIDEDEVVTYLEPDFDAGFSDPNAGDMLQTLRITSLPTTGTLTLSGGGGDVTTVPTDIPRASIAGLKYTPAPNFEGPTASFGFNVSDGALFSALAATYTFNITAQNDPPTLVDDSINRFPTQSVKVLKSELLSDDSDPEMNGPLTLTGVTYTGSTGGSVSIVGDWVFYTPGPGYLGDDTFTYDAEDTLGASSTANVDVLIIVDNTPSQNITVTPPSGPLGDVALSVVGIPGRTYTIQKMDLGDIPNWVNYDTVTMDALGQGSFLDLGPLPPARLYRTVFP